MGQITPESKRLLDTVTAITEALNRLDPSKWSVVDPREEWSSFCFVSVKAEDGRGLNIHGGWKKNQHHISGDWPTNPDRSTNFPREREKEGRTTSINVSRTKTPEQVARDIVRRLLPDYSALFAAMTKQVDDTREYEAKALAGAKMIAEAAGRIGRLYHRPDLGRREPTVDLDSSLSNLYGRVDSFSANTCTMTLRSISHEHAAILMKTLAALSK